MINPLIFRFDSVLFNNIIQKLCLYFSIAVGLEVIEEGTPLDSDGEVGHYMGNDLSDTRKCLIQVQQLNRRVRDLERDLQRNTVGFWSKLAFFAFTIINPIILHWLLWKRRWTVLENKVACQIKKQYQREKTIVNNYIWALGNDRRPFGFTWVSLSWETAARCRYDTSMTFILVLLLKGCLVFPKWLLIMLILLQIQYENSLEEN